MNKRIIKIVLALALALLALVLAVSSCAPQAVLSGGLMPAESAEPEQPEAEPSAAPEDEPAVIQPEEAPSEAAPPAEEPAPEESAAPIEIQEASGPDMADMTPAERAAAWGLPEPPDGIDLSAQQFKLANSYNSITDQRPNHSYGAGVTVDEVSSDAFNRFVADAQAAGHGVTAFRGYLDYWTVLENYYEPEVYAHGAATAAATTYVPGCNDHQTALCIDLHVGSGNGNYGEGVDFRGTEAWDWLIEHCADYGIILRYPEGQESWYGTACRNPAHFRYVGEDAARYIMDNNITLEQFMLLYDWDILYVPGVN